MIVFFNYFFPIYIFPKNIESQTYNRDQGEGALALGRTGVEEQPEYSIVSKKMDWQVAKMAIWHIWDNWQDSYHEFWVVIWRLGPRLTELLWFSFLKAIFSENSGFCCDATTFEQAVVRFNTGYIFYLWLTMCQPQEAEPRVWRRGTEWTRWRLALDRASLPPGGTIFLSLWTEIMVT